MENVQLNLKSYDQVNFSGMSIMTAALVRALIPFAEMDRPRELNESGPGGDEDLRDALEPMLSRGRSSDNTLLTNADFRNAARVLFEITGAVPSSYWCYGRPLDDDIETINEKLQSSLKRAESERDAAIQRAELAEENAKMLEAQSISSTSPDCVE